MAIQAMGHRAMTKQRRTWVPAPKGPIPKVVREELAARLQLHAEKKWKGRVRKILLRFQGAYTYIAAVEAAPGEKLPSKVCRYIEAGEVPVELCRLGYLGRWSDRWTYAFFKYSDECYDPSVVASGSFEATPEQAFDCAAGVYIGHGGYAGRGRRVSATVRRGVRRTTR